MPRSAYKVLHSKVNIRRIEQIKVIKKSSDIEGEIIVLDKKYERDVLWDIMKQIKVVRSPVKLDSDTSAVEHHFIVELMQDFEV